MPSKMNLKCWKENIPLLKQICRDNGVTDYKVIHLYTDPDDDKVYQFSANWEWTAKSWDYYQKHRVRK